MGGSYVLSDPVGAIIIGLYIMYSWAARGIGIVVQISGKSASPALLSRLTYISVKHDKRVEALVCRYVFNE